MTSFDDFLASANAEFDIDRYVKKTDPKYARKTFTCPSCDGSGKWNGGRTNRHGNAKCNQCHGTGQLVTDPRKLADNRAKAAQKRRDAKSEARSVNQAHDGGQLLKWLGEVSEWNSFATSLLEQHAGGREWSEKQVAAVGKMRANVKAKQEARAAEKVEKAIAVDLAGITALFASAFDNGYKKPMYRAEGLRIKPGKGGALYVMAEDRTEYGHFGEQPGYEGKIVDGKFFGVKLTAENTPAKLQEIAKDPLAAAIRYGRRTGTCSCCGRELTKHASIDAGIGPICAAKWGLA